MMVLPSWLVVVRYTVDSKVELETTHVNVENKNERVESLTRRSKQLAKTGKRSEALVTIGGP